LVAGLWLEEEEEESVKCLEDVLVLIIFCFEIYFVILDVGWMSSEVK